MVIRVRFVADVQAEHLEVGWTVPVGQLVSEKSICDKCQLTHLLRLPYIVQKWFVCCIEVPVRQLLEFSVSDSSPSVLLFGVTSVVRLLHPLSEDGKSRSDVFDIVIVSRGLALVDL
jgi:hypothetical protein